MKKIILGSLLMASLLFGAGEKQVEITQADVETQNKTSDASMQNITPKSLEDFFDEFKDEFGIEYNIPNEKGMVFYKGEAEVLVKEKDADFAKALQNAYNKAMLNLQGEFIKDTFGNIATKSINSLMSDNSTNAKEFEPLEKGGIFAQIARKISQLTGAQLDAALREYGITPDDLTLERKKTLFKETFVKESLTTAFGNMSGLIAVRTAITQTKRGNYQIGVIAVVSDKTRQIANDMRLKRASKITGKGGKPIMEYLPKDPKGFLQEYGTRLVYDEKGAPVIISYGNWGYLANSTDSRILDRLERVAKDTASQQADAAIIEFIKTSVSYSSKTEVGEMLDHSVKNITNQLTNESTQEEAVIANTIDKMAQTISTKASGQIRGITTLKRWNVTDENGIEHVGVVRAYSYDTYLAASAAIAPIKAKAPVKKRSHWHKNRAQI